MPVRVSGAEVGGGLLPTLILGCPHRAVSLPTFAVVTLSGPCSRERSVASRDQVV